MARETIFRRLRAAIGNGLVWGATWSGLWVIAVAGYTALGLLGVVPGISLLEAVGSAVRFGVPFGIIGFLAGGSFSAFFGILYQGRRLSEISWVRVGIGAAALAGLFVPLFLQAMNLLSGDGIVPWGLVLDDGLIAAVFGGVAGGGSIKLAQRADSLLPTESEGTDSLLASRSGGTDSLLASGSDGTDSLLASRSGGTVSRELAGRRRWKAPGEVR